jgi:organic hydroperoxide reductase OsmC/OhrA
MLFVARAYPPRLRWCRVVLVQKAAVSPSEREHYRYEDELVWNGLRRGEVVARSAPPLQVAAPPEFGGERGVWNPEQLLLAAANACLMNTYMAYAKKVRLGIVGYSCGGLADLTPDAEGGFAITRVTLKPVVLVAHEEDVARASKLMGTAERNCLIGRSLRYPTRVQPNIRVWEPDEQTVTGGAAQASAH